MPGRTRNFSGPCTNYPVSNRREDRQRNDSHPQLTRDGHQNNSRRSARIKERTNRRDDSVPSLPEINQQLEVIQHRVPPELPGMYYDAQRGRYFTIADSYSGISGYNKFDLARRIRREETINSIHVNSKLIKERRGPISVTTLLSRLQLGANVTSMQRSLDNVKVMNVKSTPHSMHTIVDNEAGQITGCKFLSVSNDATSIFGCWTLEDLSSFSDCVNVKVDKEVQNQAFYNYERDDSKLQNTMGLVFEQNNLENSRNRIIDPEVVDMCIAPIDTDVTGCLYVTAAARFEQNQLRSRCSVFLHPLADWSSPESEITLNSPIYNIYMSGPSQIWSCGWSPNNMYISLGLEECALICNIVTDKKFHISTKGKSVVCQKFSPDGNIIIMCPRAKKIMCSDLRMSNKHCIDGEEDWPRTSSCCFVQPLKNQYNNHVLTQGFNGQMKLWDLRQKTSPVLEYEGHKNNGYKLSCIVDSEEKFVFAVGDDGCTRGWSITSGELLCELPTPNPLTENSEYPRLAYSDQWGGIPGNTALIVATSSCINVHQLEL